MTRPLIRLVEVPEPARPDSCFAVVVRNKRPIVVLDLRPQFSSDTRGTYRTGIPCIRRRLPQILTGRATRCGKLSAAFLIDPAPIADDQTLHGFDECR